MKRTMQLTLMLFALVGESQAGELSGPTAPLDEKVRRHLAGQSQQYTRGEKQIIYAVASGRLAPRGDYAFLARGAALHVLKVQNIQIPSSHKDYQTLRATLRDSEKAGELYFDCKWSYESRYKVTGKLWTLVEQVNNKEARALWKDIRRFKGPFKPYALGSNYEHMIADELYEARGTFQRNEPLSLADAARIEYVAGLFHRYFLATELEHIKISLLELKLANHIQRGWGKYADNDDPYQRPEPSEKDPYLPKEDDPYFDKFPSPRKIVTYRGTFTVEDFNDFHLFGKEPMDDTIGFEALLPKDDNMPGLSGSAVVVTKRMKWLVAGKKDTFSAAMHLTSPVLRSLSEAKDSPQVVALKLGRLRQFVPRPRPRTFATCGSPMPTDPADGLTRDKLPASVRKATAKLISHCQRYGGTIYVQSPADTLWRPAKVEGVLDFMGEVYVKHVGSSRRERVPFARILVDPTEAEPKTTVNPKQAPSYRSGDEELKWSR